MTELHNSSAGAVKLIYGSTLQRQTRPHRKPTQKAYEAWWAALWIVGRYELGPRTQSKALELFPGVSRYALRQALDLEGVPHRPYNKKAAPKKSNGQDAAAAALGRVLGVL